MTTFADIPANWAMATLGDVCRKCDQRVPSPAEEFTYVDIGSVDREKKAVVGAETISGANAPSRARKQIMAGDVLVSMTRPNLNAIALVPPDLSGQIASTGFEVLRPTIVSSDYIYYVVRSQTFVDEMTTKVQGALYPAVKSADIREFEFPLPPLAEQKQIAAKLDELLAQVDTIKARLDAIPAVLKRFRQSVLAAAVSGRLAEDWRLDRGVEPSFSSFEVGEIAFVTKLAGFEYTKHVTYNPAGDLKVLKAENVGTEGFRSTEFSKVFSDDVAMLSRSKVYSGDLIMVFVGAGTGQIAMIPEGDDWFLGPNIALIRPRKDLVIARYLELYFRSIHGWKEVFRFQKSTAQPSLSMKTIRQMEVYLPAIEEQTEIVRRVDQLFTFANQIEQRLQTALARVNHLTQSMLAKAFRGELTADWRQQNPDLISGNNSAAALLARIRMERTVKPGRARKNARPQV